MGIQLSSFLRCGILLLVFAGMWQQGNAAHDAKLLAALRCSIDCMNIKGAPSEVVGELAGLLRASENGVCPGTQSCPCRVAYELEHGYQLVGFGVFSEAAQAAGVLGDDLDALYSGYKEHFAYRKFQPQTENILANLQKLDRQAETGKIGWKEWSVETDGLLARLSDVRREENLLMSG